MALEWKEARGVEIPQFLSERLSRNLFLNDAGEDAAITPAEALGNALFGSSADASLHVGDLKFALNRASDKKQITKREK